MKNLLSLLVLVLLVVSCAKESIAPTEEAPSQLKVAQDYLLKSPSVLLFANLELNHETNRINGFVIDKKGEVYNIFNMHRHGVDLSSGHISDHVMRQILDHGEKDAQTDLSPIELVNYAKKIGSLKKTNDLEESVANAKTTSTLISFQRDFSHEMPASCGPGAYDHGPSHHKIVITAKGKYDFDNSSAAGPVLTDWLSNLRGTPVVESN